LGFPTKTLYTFLSPPMRATCPAHLIRTDLICPNVLLHTLFHPSLVVIDHVDRVRLYLWTAATNWPLCSSPRWYLSMECDTVSGKPKDSEINLSQCNFVHHKSNPGREPGPQQWEASN
jgi:hypothetical protein